MPDEVIRPFRWDVARPSQLGSLADGELPATYPEFEDDLLTCAARALARCADGDVVFVGRSPEPLFHLLRGVLDTTSWSDRLLLFNVALRDEGLPAGAEPAILPYLDEIGLSPAALLTRPRPAVLVDVVATGGTLADLIVLVHDWADRVGVDWRAASRKLRIVGLTWREKTSPNTWRWQQHVDAVRLLPSGAVKNVSAPPRLLSSLASSVPKMTDSFSPSR